MPNSPETRVILVTAPHSEKAAEIARILVHEQLAACVNIIPQLISIYRWEGKVAEESEVLMLIKSSAAKIEQLQSRVLQLHPYTTPEFVVLTPESVLATYEKWLIDCM